MKDCCVVIPAYKEDPHTIVNLYCSLEMMGAEVIVVNDGNTIELPSEIKQVSYSPNKGYGYALKQGIVATDKPYVITLDGDGQHLPSDAYKLYTVFKMITDCDMLVGTRWNISEKWYRQIGRKCLNFLATCVAGHYLIDLNSGMRIFKRDLAVKYMPILCDVFSFTTSLTMSMVSDGYKIAWFPIDVKPRAHGKSHVRVIKDGLITLAYILYIGFGIRTRGIRAWLRRLRGSR